MLHISCFLATSAMWKWGWKKKDNWKKGGCPLHKSDFFFLKRVNIGLWGSLGITTPAGIKLRAVAGLWSFAFKNAFCCSRCNVCLASQDDASSYSANVSSLHFETIHI